MQPLTEGTIKLLSRSGFVLIFLSLIGSFAMAAITVSGNIQEQTWDQFFGVLFLAVIGIATYYLSLSLFGWVLLRAKKYAGPTTP